MYFFAPFVLLSFSSIVQAASTPARPGLSLALTRHSDLHTSNGFVHVENHRRHIHHVTSDVYGWICSVKIGATNFNLILDTGSTDLLVPGNNCTACGNITHFYNPHLSGGKDLRKNVSEIYGSANATGELYQDAVSIAGLKVQHQTFVAATAYSDGLDFSSELDGIAGFAYPSLSSINATPLFQSLVQQKQIASGVFGVSLAPNCSKVHLGGIDPNYLDKDFAHFNIVGKKHNRGFWMVNTTAVSAGGVDAMGPKFTIVDTGTSFVIVDNRTAGDFYKKIHGSSYYEDGIFSIPCGFDKNVTVTFSGDKNGFDIPPGDFKLGAADVGSNATGTGTCYGAIVAADLEKDQMILGDVFLRNVYTKFDFDKNQVGFAALRKC
ncbi:aspartic peptidase domain-containing protein [Russula brevipes]|nr:aspartic peptidase domain-containing protein [Russula brevipes]